MCVEVVLINILASRLAPQTKIPGSAPAALQPTSMNLASKLPPPRFNQKAITYLIPC